MVTQSKHPANGLTSTYILYVCVYFHLALTLTRKQTFHVKREGLRFSNIRVFSILVLKLGEFI